MGRWGWIIFIAIVLFTGFRAVQRAVAAPEFSQKDLERIARSVQLLLPQTNGATRTDRIEALPGRVLHYHNTFWQYPRAELNAAKLIEHMWPRVRHATCVDPDILLALRAGVRYSYSYSGNDGGYVGRIDVISSDCQRY